METFNIYAILTPIAVLLLISEITYSLVTKKKIMNFQDSITNMGTAIGNQLTNLLVMGIVFICFGWINDNFSLMQIETNWWTFTILLILFDFLFYWFHRHGHTINILWAAHMPHHTSEEFNLFVGLRASITQRLFSFTYMWPLAIIGFSAEAIYMASAVQLILAYWHHTKLIPKMGWFEVIFNSPSYHRVHHAINDKYLDKNFGEIFIIWDKMFGTCAVEDEPVVYGSLNPVESWNPNKIYAHFWLFLLEDAINTKSWWDKIRLWFMPLGWRPEDCRQNPRKRINAQSLKKYQTQMLTNLEPYLIVHLILGMACMYLVIASQSPLSNMEKVIASLGLWLMITSWGSLLEAKSWAKYFEVLRLIIMGGIFSFLGYKYYSQDIPILITVLCITSIIWVIAKLKINKPIAI